MKSRLMGRIEKRYCELSEAGGVLEGDQLRRVRNLPLLHLMKLSDALDAETVGLPSSIVEMILRSCGNEN